MIQLRLLFAMIGVEGTHRTGGRSEGSDPRTRRLTERRVLFITRPGSPSMPKLERLSALALNCTLKASSADDPSSTDKLLADMLAAMEPYGVQGEVVRVADHN